MKTYTQRSSSWVADRLQHYASFRPYLAFLKFKMNKTADIRAKFYKYIISKFERHPELLQPITDMQVLENNEEIIQLLRMSLLPLSANSDHFIMALAFIKPSSIFYYTEPFRKLLIDEQVDFNSEEDEKDNLKYLINLVLERCYHLNVEIKLKTIKRVYSSERHFIRYHNIIVDSRFLEVESIGSLPELNNEWIEILAATDNDIPALFDKFPFEKFRFEGFCILNAEDVSQEVAINGLKNAILNMHTIPLEETLTKVEVAIGELMNDPGIRIGITPFFKVNGNLVTNRSFITKCVLISADEKNRDHPLSINEIYNNFTEHPHPFIFEKINKNSIQALRYLDGLLESGIKSFMAYPIRTRDGLLGVFELASTEENAVSAKTIDQLQQAFPMITDLVYFMIKSFDNRINELIKEKFTSLHSSVEWKFNEVAWQYLVREPDGLNEVGNIAFDGVYPLYGAVDIRNSSVERDVAMRKDYLYQLTATKDLLDKASGNMSLVLLEDLQYKCERLIESTHETLTPGDEVHINSFINSEVSVFLKHLSTRHPTFAKDVDDYLNQINEATGMFYHNRRAYENSLKMINNKVVAYLQDEVLKLQAVYPFYFEKYRSDGVEYNIYIGQSISPSQAFDQIFLKNIRIWQLSSMAAIARSLNKMLPDMPLPLETTQLILVHSHPIQISFRKDEHRFDVEGYYNIRYEIIKKRLDKVRIKATQERLTQPGHISIVYTNLGDIDEYMEHIKFLQKRGILSDVLEMHELEELQGVSGLKAVRTGVNYD